MSDPKEFLTRWSRRKLGSTDDAAEAAPVAPASGEGATPAPADATPVEEFDAESLPSIESIGAGSDIRAFLQRGVPAGLTRAALRRAWSADPAIRDFIGLSENAWDFNAPDSMPGFGPLAPEEVRRLAAQLFGEPGAEPTGLERNTSVQASAVEGKPEAAAMHEMRRSELEATPGQDQGLQKIEDNPASTSAEGQHEVDIAVQYKEEKPEYDRTSSRQRHGGALPKQT